MHDANILATSQGYILSTFRDTDGLPLPALPPRSETTSDGAIADASLSRKSSRDIARRAAKGDVGARLDCWSIHDVERSLENTQLPGSEISLLSCLRSPNVNKAEVVKEILEHMSDRAEEHAMWMALVWRYAKEHEVWKNCSNPRWRTEDAFLDSLEGYQTARICIQFGTSTDVARRGKMNIIGRNWGEGWYQEALARTLLPQQERGAAGLSKRLLKNIAEMSNVVGLNHALDLWENAVQERTAVGSRNLLGWKAATTTHLLPCDLERLTKELEEEEDAETPSVLKRRDRQSHGSDASEEILELRSSAGYSSMSPFGARTQTIKSTVSTMPRSQGKQARKRRTLGQKPSSKRSHSKEAPRTQKQQPRQPQGANQELFDLEGEDYDKEQEEEDAGDRDDGHDENSENCYSKSAESAEIATSIADLEARTRKHRFSQVEQQASEDLRKKKARLGEANISGEATNRLGESLTGSATTGKSASMHVILDEAGSASLSSDAAHGAGGVVVEHRANVAEHPLRIGTQPVEGEAANTEAVLPSFAALMGNDGNEVSASATRPERSASSDCTALSTDGFIESVADGSAFKLLEQASASAASRQDCPLCGSVCLFCEVPTSIDELQRGRMYEYAHQAHDLEKKAQEQTLRKWLRRIRYATPTHGLLQGEGEVCVLSAQSFKSQMKEGRPLDRPVIIKEGFADSDEWTVARYAELLDSVFDGFDIDVRWHQDPEPQSVPVSKMVEFCRGQMCSTLSTNPPNMLNLSDITGATTPTFLRMDRFRLLDLVIERCKAKPRRQLAKQLELTPFDVASSRSFNLLAWPGAFSGAHVDSIGATWVRNLFGYKLWMFVPVDRMRPGDWDQLAKDSDRWDPGDKARAVLLCPGDVFVMRAGLVHAVQTLGDTGPCLMTGGSFWDDRDLLHTIKTQLWIAKNQSATNEPLAYQLAQVIDALEDMIERRPFKYSGSGNDIQELINIIGELRSIGCACEDCSDEEDCNCSREGRRCTPFCTAHAYTDTVSKPCMLEARAASESVNTLEERDEDYGGSD